MLAAGGALLPPPPAVHACTCLQPAAPSAPDPGRVVFEGTATGLHGLDLGLNPVQDQGVPRRAVWTFAVDRVLTGSVGDPPEVVTGLGGGDCGASFAIGNRYQVVALRLPAGAPADIAGRLVTSVCAGNRPLSAEQSASLVPPPVSAPAADAPPAPAPGTEAPPQEAPATEAPAEAPEAEAPSLPPGP
jgi:hypothetical protein